jgi:hypothetical protein
MVPSFKKRALASKKRAPRPAAVMFSWHIQRSRWPFRDFLDKTFRQKGSYFLFHEWFRCIKMTEN